MATLERIDAHLIAYPSCVKDFKAEWQWWRYLVAGKMFAATLCPGPEHNELYAGRMLLTLKCDPLLSERVRYEHSDILPGFYIDKRHWISVDINRSVPDDLLFDLMDHSYALVFDKLPKKVQRTIQQESQ